MLVSKLDSAITEEEERKHGREVQACYRACAEAKRETISGSASALLKTVKTLTFCRSVNHATICPGTS